MPWVVFPDNTYDHERIVRAGNEGVGLWFRMMCWSSNHLTDGIVPIEIVKSMSVEPEWLAERKRVAVWLSAQGHRALADDMLARMPNSQGPIEQLLRATMPQGRSTNPNGLISVVNNNSEYYIEKYPLYQPLSKDVKSKREADRDRKRRERGNVQPESERSRARDPIPSHPSPDLDPPNPPCAAPAVPVHEHIQLDLPASPAAPPQAAPAGKKRRRASDTKQNGEPAAHILYAEAFAAGISDHTGKECSVDRAGRYHFIALCAAHAKDGGRPLVGAELIAWIRHTAKEFAAANDPRFGGYTVHRMRTWLDSGRPNNSGMKPAALQPSLAQPSWHRKKETSQGQT